VKSFFALILMNLFVGNVGHCHESETLKVYEQNAWWLSGLAKAKTSEEVYLADNSAPPQYWKNAAVKSTEAKEWALALKLHEENLLRESGIWNLLSKDLMALNKNSKTPVELIIRKRKELQDVSKTLTIEGKTCLELIEKLLSFVEARSQGPLMPVHSQLGPKIFKKDDLLFSLSESQRSVASFLLKLK
jgi:hypothetical protein